jgi:hypothetical protein
MKKLNKETLDLMRSTADICNKLNFEAFVIDSESCRAAKSSAILCTPHKDGTIDSDLNIAISRIPLFLTRLRLAESSSGKELEVYAHDADQKGYVKKLVFKGKRTSIDFSCANPNNIRTYKTLKDPLFYDLKIDEALAGFLSGIKGASAGIKTFSISVDSEKSRLFSVDGNGDIVSYSIDGLVTKLPDSDKDDFSFSYDLDGVLPILTNCIGGSVQISRRGMWRMTSDRNIIYIIPGA